jgi:pimeloyl-ACP methyl ester carboxylesterase
LLHGFPTSSWDWQKIWNPLRHNYQLITLDFIGFGYSDKPQNHAYSILEQATIVEQLLTTLKIESYHLLVHDIGDTVTQELLARQLERGVHKIKSCCLLNGGLFPETHKPTQTQKLLLSWIGPIVSKLFSFKRFVKSFSLIFSDQTRPDLVEMQSLYELIQYNGGNRIGHLLIKYILERRQYRERWLVALQQATCPLRLINGVDDPISGAHMAERYKQVIPNADVVEISGCGHYPQMEMPDKVLENYSQFRKSVASRNSS